MNKFILKTIGVIICLDCGCISLIYKDTIQDECNDCASENLTRKQYLLNEDDKED